MFFSGNLLGISTFQYATGNIALRREYAKIRIYGNATIDKLQIRNYEMDNTTIKNIPITNNLIWDSSTILACEFENNLKGGNILNLGTDPVIQWQVQREEVGTSNSLKVLDTVDVSQISYIDYIIQANKTYIYEIFPLTTNQVGEALQSNEINTSDIYGFFLIGTDSDGTTYSYKMDLNVKSNSVDINEDFTEYNSYTRYNSYAIGKRNFYKTSLQFLAGDISTDTGEILQSPDYIEILKNRIQDGRVKYFKTRKGEIYKGLTHAYSATQLEDGISKQLYLVKFEFIQSSDV